MGTRISNDAGRSRPRENRNVPVRTGQRTTVVHDREIKAAPWHSSDFVSTEKDRVTNFLGWFSIGLGLAEVLAPHRVARLIGIDEDRHTTLLRAFGVRELAAGVGILTRPKPTYWMWNRVLGDAIDLQSLKRAMNDGNDKSRLKLAALAVAGVTALDIASSIRLTREDSPAAGEDPGSFKAATSTRTNAVASAVITVNRPVEDVYAFWKDARNYAQFMDQIESVNPTTSGKSHWKVKGPPGFSVEWDAQMVQDIPNELIRWTSTSNAAVDNTGTVRFSKAAGNRGTVVALEIEYKPKAGLIGARAAKIFSALPKTQASNDLRRFKQLIEIGEVVKSDATVTKGMHAAQPADEQEALS